MKKRKLLICSTLICSLAIGFMALLSVPVHASDTVYYGKYVQQKVVDEKEIDYLRDQDIRGNDTYVDGIRYINYNGDYYKDAPIEWYVIGETGDSYVLLSKYILSNAPFTVNVTGSHFWNDSYIREFLNTTFMDRAFSEDQKKYLKTMTQSTDECTYEAVYLEKRDDPYETITTEDKVFLLSEQDIMGGAYSFSGGKLKGVRSPSEIAAGCTDGDWYLRGPCSWFYGNQKALIIGTSNEDGKEYFYDVFGTYDRGVRPCICVKKDAPELSAKNPGELIPIGVSSIGKYIVKYNTGGGTGIASQIKKPFTILKLSKAVPKHKSKVFTGWATSKNGKVVYKPGDSYKKDKNLTLYAKWRESKTSSNNVSAAGLKTAKKKYTQLKTMLAKGTYPIPGLKTSCVRTDSGKYMAECDNMIPQGVCTAKGYIFITEYCKDKSHNSVIQVLNQKTGKYVGTITLQDKNHCGGIAYDGKGYLWIAKSSSGKVSTLSVDSAVSKAKKKDAPLVKYKKTFTCYYEKDNEDIKIKSASFVTFDDGKLWVGYCNTENSKNAILYGYSVKYKSGKPSAIKYKQGWPVAHHANGATFVNKGGKKYLIISSETGAKHNSNLISYLANDDGKMCSFRKIKTVTLPPLHEELDISGNKVYSIYESGAKEFKGRVKNGAELGVVCVGSKAAILKMLDIK